MFLRHRNTVPLALRRELAPRIGQAFVRAAAVVWLVPILWMLVASMRPQSFGGPGMASLIPDVAPTLQNFVDAWEAAALPRYYLNTVLIVAGILADQLITSPLAGFAFARVAVPGKQVLFYLFLLQLMLDPVVLIVANLPMAAPIGLYATLAGVMAPYVASAFGTFLLRQKFAAVPRE